MLIHSFIIIYAGVEGVTVYLLYKMLQKPKHFLILTFSEQC